jgi:flagella basal body P-ring formation protein FlgA
MEKNVLKSLSRLLQIVVVMMACCHTVSAAELVIELKDVATVFSPQVLLRDVAKVKSLSVSDRIAAEAVELRLLDLTVPDEAISARSITTRLVLAGWLVEEIRVIGSPEVRVSFRQPELLTDTVIEEAATEVAFAIMGGDREDLVVKLQGVFVQSLPPDIRDVDGLMAKVNPPQKVGPGRSIMQIQIWDGDRIVATRSAAFDIRKRQTVAVARIALTRDMPIDERSVQFERRFVSTTLDELDGSQVFGQRVRANVVPGTILQARDFQTTPAGGRILIKKGDLVTAYARAGKLQTRLRNVEAMQDAGLGDNIKLLNRESDNLFSGKVMSPGTVLVIIDR